VPETTFEAVLAYLHEHGRHYNVRDLRRHLVSQGFDAALIDTAIVAYESEGRNVPLGAEAPRSFISGAFLVAIVACVLDLVFFSIPFLHVLLNEKPDHYGEAFKRGEILVWEMVGGLLLALAGWIVGLAGAQRLRAFGLRFGWGLVLGGVVSVGLTLLGVLIIVGGVCSGILKGV
jgi:hypothetical protein